MSNITFRLVEKKDLPDRVKWFNTKDISKYLSTQFRKGTTLKKQEEWYSNYLKDSNKKIFVIEYDGKPIGNVGLTEISQEDNHAGLVIFIGEKEYQGKGIGKKAVQYIVDYGFDKLNLHQIWLYVCAANTNAIKLYEKCGFAREGLLKEMWKYGDKYEDEIVMAIFNPKDKKEK